MTDQKETKALAVQDLSKQFPSDKYNALLPSRIIGSISPLQKLTIEVLEINPDPSHGEVFEVAREKGKDGKWHSRYGLTKTALDRIAHTLGISWYPDKTRRVDDRSNPNIVEFTAVGVLRKPDGSVQVLSGTKEIDLNALERELMLNLEIAAKKGNLKVGQKTLKFETKECQEYIDMKVRKRMIELQKYKVAIAESGAKNRAVRSLGLKPSYTEEDLAKPFVVPRIDFNPELALADPKLKEKLVAAAVSAGIELYGPPAMEIPEGRRPESAHVSEPEKEDEESPNREVEETEEESPISEEDERRMSLEGLTQEERTEIAIDLAKKTDHKVSTEKFKERAVENQIKNIMAMEAELAEAEEEDDLPF